MRTWRGDNVELQYGRDSLGFDEGLNAMLMYVPRYSAKHLERLIKLYDIPTYDVDVKYLLYEIDAENDTKIGLDFQRGRTTAARISSASAPLP